MRDPNRIDKFCDELKEMWHRVPDWRFGQFFFNTVIGQIGDPFFIEDDKCMELMHKFFESGDSNEE